MKDPTRRSRDFPATGREEAPYSVAAPETLEGLLKRDLDAWLEAKAIIASAKGR